MWTRGKELSELSSTCCYGNLQALSTLMSVSDGDLRRAITLLQSASQLKYGEEITKEDFYNLGGVRTIEQYN